MKLVFFVHRYWPSVGGVEKYIHELCRSLLNMGHEVDVVAGATVPGLRAYDEHEGVRIHRFPATRSPVRCRLWMWRHLALFRAADVVHVSNTHMIEYFWRMMGPLVEQRKVFLTRHGMSYIHPSPEIERRRALRSLGLAAGVVHDGEFIAKWLDVRADICPDQGLSPMADELTPVPEPEPNSAVHIGRLEPDTGIDIYIEAVRLLNEEFGIPFSLDVYGDGSLLPNMRERAERQNLPITFHGRQPDAQSHITDACFAFIDGRMAIQEAMARRRLVLAAYPDPLKFAYVAGERFSPYLISAASGVALALQVRYFLNHPAERALRAEYAFEHARALTWDRTAAAYLSFWRKKLSLRAARASRLARLVRSCRLERESWSLTRPMSTA